MEISINLEIVVGLTRPHQRLLIRADATMLSIDIQAGLSPPPPAQAAVRDGCAVGKEVLFSKASDKLRGADGPALVEIIFLDGSGALSCEKDVFASVY